MAESSAATTKLPLVVNGARRQSDEAGTIELPFVTGRRVELPRLSAGTVDAICAADKFVTRDLPLCDIVAFLRNVGHNWRSSEYARRRIYVRQLVDFLGYSQAAAEHEADWIAMVLSSHVALYDIVAAELGSRHALDTWRANEEAEVRAFPIGRTLHVLSGNVPLAGVGSIVRALITKNSCVVKASSDDPFTPISLALSFLDTDPMHPMARALSVVHWRGGQEGEVEKKLLRSADAICAWGGADAMEWVTRAAGPETEIVRFGPRRSVAVVGRDADVDKAALAIAHDACVYDQRACFSVQQVFSEIPTERLVPALQRALDKYETLLPRGCHDFDAQGRASLAALDASFAGAEVKTAANRVWTIITTPPGRVSDHPLGRTLFVHPIADASEVPAHLGPDIQTVAVTPWALALTHRDAFARAGVFRIVELGLTNLFRPGGAHDGFFPLQRLVRIASVELPGRIHPRSVALRIDQTELLERKNFQELVP